ncbi:MAG: hypothetical protein AB8G22_09330 [Saprospiraceae bacterium]
MQLPGDYTNFINYWKENADQLIDDYQQSRKWSFIPALLPEIALQLRASTLMEILRTRLDIDLKLALDPTYTIESPLSENKDSSWLKSVNMVGINVRTIGSFWNIVRYALTLPKSQSAIHILPIWEPGVVASLYGMSSWNINSEFYSEELAMLFPHLDTVEKQLKVVINILHGMGKTVGMDVIPHCDRFSEIVLAHPCYFEWLQRSGMEIINHSENLHERIEEAVYMFISVYGRADKSLPKVNSKEEFFDLTEEKRLLILFGPKEDLRRRLQRRNQLIQHLYESGYETVPATMAPPYREIEIDPDPKAQTIDRDGRLWVDFKIVDPEPMSRVFGPLTRYKLYERWNDNEDWEIQFDAPRPRVWNYVKEKYATVHAEYNFHFMRVDMSHVQMRPDGVPAQADDYYDIHRSIVEHVQQTKPYFGYFAETFLAPAGHMAYGDEVDHLELSKADSTLGDLQSMVVGSQRFLQNLRRYIDIAQNRSFVPNLTLMTADKDDPRFDEFYVAGNEARLFMALFVTDMPSYMGLGFESRDVHLQPAPNEYYTKLYVFFLETGPKATRGKYIFGKNTALFSRLTRIKLLAETLLPQIEHQTVRWLLPPDSTGSHKVIAWTQTEQPQYVFVVNLDIENGVEQVKIPVRYFEEEATLKLLFSTENEDVSNKNAISISNKYQFSINELAAGECQIFQVV